MSQEPLDAREVTFGDVTFQIGKMFPMEAKRVFMNHVRPLLRGALSAETNGGDQWQLLLAAFTDAPQEHYDAITRSLYSHIQYKNSEATVLMPLLGDEENAFKELDMAHSLMLDGRAFYVNFHESWGVVTSALPSLSQAFQSLKHST